MIFKYNVKLEKGRLDIAPLIDVIFLLLIFFMLTSSFITPQGIRVNLPKAKKGLSLPKGGLVIYISNKGELIVDEEIVDLDNLSEKIGDAAKRKIPILIRADKDVPLGKVVETWDLCRKKGVSNVNIATIPKD